MTEESAQVAPITGPPVGFIHCVRLIFATPQMIGRKQQVVETVASEYRTEDGAAATDYYKGLVEQLESGTFKVHAKVAHSRQPILPEQTVAEVSNNKLHY